MLWPKDLSKRIKTKVNLRGLTTFKIGGPAQYYFLPLDLTQLQQALAAAKAAGVRVFILGSGSNVLVSDRGVRGLVIKLGGGNFNRIYQEGSCVIAASGLKLNQLIAFAAQHNLSGAEFLAGIPGSLGGAIMGNAGAWGSCVGGLVRELGVLDYSGRPRLLKGRQLKFSYRKSNLDKYIIVWAKLKLRERNKKVITGKIKEYLLLRKDSQSNRLPNAGCIFKNPKGDFVGRLIESCQLKGRIKNGAVISTKHANFILNAQQAKCRDVLFLMDLVQKKVKDKFKINLEPEIKIWE